jgi:hypothetical protein
MQAFHARHATYALAGERDGAARFFARASRSCSVRDDFYRTKARLALAESEPDGDRACALATEVAAHWKGAPRSATAAIAKQRRCTTYDWMQKERTEAND